MDYLGHGVLHAGVNYAPAAVSVDVYQAAPGDTATTPANPGDPVVAVPDKQINADDIQRLLAETKFNSGTAADWSQGDFNDDGFCDSSDIQLILASALFNAGPYGAAAVGWASPTAGSADGVDNGVDRWAVPTLRVTPAGLLIDTGDATINGYVLRSAAGVFTGAAADNLGLLQTDGDRELSGQMFFSLNGTHLLGRVVGSEWAGVDLAQDLSMTYTIAGRAGIYTASVVVPEPGTVAMLAGVLLAAVVLSCRRRRCA
jgi:hypothetical protein